MKSIYPPEVLVVIKTCVSSKNLCNKIHLHKLEKHQSISHIMSEEKVEGNDNMSEILLQK